MAPKDTFTETLSSSSNEILPWILHKVVSSLTLAAFGVLVTVGWAQYWTYNAAGYAMRLIGRYLTVFTNAIRRTRAVFARLKELSSPTPPQRCKVCRTLLEYCNAGFVYGDMPDSTSHFRLVRLTAQQDEDRVCCEMGTFAVDQAPPYTALSYRWTQDEPRNVVTLNGEQFFVRDNLFSFLSTLRREGHRGWVFVDAICTNQHDLVERSHQVALMRNIYERAKSVTVWIGVVLDNASSQLASGKQMKEAQLFMRENAPSRSIMGRLRDQLAQSTGEQDDPDARLLWSFACTNEYWTRLWPVQEILVASAIEFKAEHTTIPWNRMVAIPKKKLFKVKESRVVDPFRPPYHIIEALPEDKLTTHIITMMVQLVTRKSKMWRLGNAQERMPLYEAILAFAAQHCAEPRDKIFGLLGISCSHVRADYRMSLAEVYLRALLEGIIGIQNDRAPTESAAMTHQKLKVFCCTLQYALGMHALDPAVMLMTQGVFDSILPPAWIFNDHSWLGPGPLQRVFKPFIILQGDEMYQYYVLLAWMSLYQYHFYWHVCRQAVEQSVPLLRRFQSTRVLGWQIASLVLDLVVVLAFSLRQLQLAVLHVHGGAVALGGGEHEEALTCEQWAEMRLRVVRDMKQRGLVSDIYTDVQGYMERVRGESEITEPNQVESAVKPGD